MHYNRISLLLHLLNKFNSQVIQEKKFISSDDCECTNIYVCI